jgi:CRISPR-associated protein Csb3
MAEASIPVDLLNPGQVFACLGFMEAAEILIGNVRGGFDWSDETDIRFRLLVESSENPIEAVLSALAKAEVVEMEPINWPDTHNKNALSVEEFPCHLSAHYVGNKWSRTKLPAKICLSLETQHKSIDLLSWTDGSSRPEFKLFSGNRTGASIACDMLSGKRGKATKRLPEGKIETFGLRQLWDRDQKKLIDDPFNVTCEVAGSFNMDPRGAWTAMDVGFSLNEHKNIRIVASPVVEILAMIGLEHARPDEYETRSVRYAIWNELLPPILARAAFAAINIDVKLRKYRFKLDLSGKNKIVTFSEPETI